MFVNGIPFIVAGGSNASVSTRTDAADDFDRHVLVRSLIEGHADVAVRAAADDHALALDVGDLLATVGVAESRIERRSRTTSAGHHSPA